MLNGFRVKEDTKTKRYAQNINALQIFTVNIQTALKYTMSLLNLK